MASGRAGRLLRAPDDDRPLGLGTGNWGSLRGVADCMPSSDPLQAQAVRAFTAELAAGRVPSVRAIRVRLYVGKPRAQRLRAYLAALNGTRQAGVTFELPGCQVPQR